MDEYLSKAIDRLVDRIDALILLRAERMEFPGAFEAADEFRTALADSLCDFVSALRETAS